jgi:hypothetical protein
LSTLDASRSASSYRHIPSCLDSVVNSGSEHSQASGSVRRRDFMIRRALGSFSSVSSNPALQAVFPLSGSGDALLVASASSPSCMPIVTSHEDSIVIDHTPFRGSIVDTMMAYEDKLLATPASLHRHLQNTHEGDEDCSIPVVNVFYRSAIVPLKSPLSASDSEVFSIDHSA